MCKMTLFKIFLVETPCIIRSIYKPIVPDNVYKVGSSYKNIKFEIYLHVYVCIKYQPKIMLMQIIPVNTYMFITHCTWIIYLKNSDSYHSRRLSVFSL